VRASSRALNAWIRDNGVFDAVIDFEAALRDPDHPTRTLPRWDSGDRLHGALPARRAGGTGRRTAGSPRIEHLDVPKPEQTAGSGMSGTRPSRCAVGPLPGGRDQLPP
jgi:hypothetical protein